MTKSKYTEEQILFALKQEDAGQAVAEKLPSQREAPRVRVWGALCV
jgi:hypothetical protein